MRIAGDSPDGGRLRALIVILWRAGLRISEALALQESDLDRDCGAVLVRHGKGRQTPRGRNGPLGMVRTRTLARGTAPTARWRVPMRDPRHDRRKALGSIGGTQTASPRGTRNRVRRRFAPHQLRHAHAVEMAHEGVRLVVIQRQLGHADLGIISIYLPGIDSAEIINTVHGRPSPMISARRRATTQIAATERRADHGPAPASVPRRTSGSRLGPDLLGAPSADEAGARV